MRRDPPLARAALAEAYDPGADESKSAASMARLTGDVLSPAMNIKQALAHFHRLEAEALAVVDGPDQRHVIGLLGETFAVRRHTEELDNSHRDLIGEPD